MTGQVARTSSLFSIAAIVISMFFVAIGNGIMLAYVPYVLTLSGAPAWSSGAAVTAMAFGGLIGCIVAGPVIRRVGHARAFSCVMALVIIAAVLVALGFYPLIWILARGLYGAASTADFIVAQSWLNHASDNRWRGKAMSFFYMTYVLGLGLGAWVFGQLPAEGNMAPLITVLSTTLALLPIGLTKLPTPPPPARVKVDFAMVWRNSPVALAGILASGGLSMVVQGFTPIYASSQNVSQADVALLMFSMQFGLIFVQYPLGTLSDRIDRRIVLIGTCLLITGAAVAALFTTFQAFVLLIFVYAIWSGATESVYSIANAHANDRTDPEDFVPLASTMLVAWSISATLVPLAVTMLTPVLGAHTFIYAVIAVALAYTGFVASRLTRRETVPPEERESFELRSAQLPNAGALVEGQPPRD